jgi:PIN domain nuclease of toxin-antitoxin system
MTDQYDELLLSAISQWEFSKLIEKKRIGISCDPVDWINHALDMPKFRMVPLSPLLAYPSTVLPRPFHDDPADQIIVATARKENAPFSQRTKEF